MQSLEQLKLVSAFYPLNIDIFLPSHLKKMHVSSGKLTEITKIVTIADIYLHVPDTFHVPSFVLHALLVVVHLNS